MEPVITFYGVGDDTRVIARQLIWATAIPNIIIWAPAFTLPNALRAANDVKFTMIVAIVLMWTIRVGAGYLLSVVFGLGVVGIWYAMVFEWLLRALFYFIRFAGSSWEKHQILAYTSDSNGT